METRSDLDTTRRPSASTGWLALNFTSCIVWICMIDCNHVERWKKIKISATHWVTWQTLLQITTGSFEFVQNLVLYLQIQSSAVSCGLQHNDIMTNFQAVLVSPLEERIVQISFQVLRVRGSDHGSLLSKGSPVCASSSAASSSSSSSVSSSSSECGLFFSYL